MLACHNKIQQINGGDWSLSVINYFGSESELEFQISIINHCFALDKILQYDCLINYIHIC